MELTDAELIAAVLRGDAASYEPLVSRYQSRLFAMARRYVRSESEAEDLVQDILIKAYQKLGSYRGEAPFEHWLMRLAVRACYDCLRSRRKETAFSELSEPEAAWLEGCAADAETPRHDADAARLLVNRALSQLPAPARLVITLLEIEERPIKEIAVLTGWSVPLVKVRAFRARNLLRKVLKKMSRDKFL